MATRPACAEKPQRLRPGRWVRSDQPNRPSWRKRGKTAAGPAHFAARRKHRTESGSSPAADQLAPTPPIAPTPRTTNWRATWVKEGHIEPRRAGIDPPMACRPSRRCKSPASTRRGIIGCIIWSHRAAVFGRISIIFDSLKKFTVRQTCEKRHSRGRRRGDIWAKTRAAVPLPRGDNVPALSGARSGGQSRAGQKMRVIGNCSETRLSPGRSSSTPKSRTAMVVPDTERGMCSSWWWWNGTAPPATWEWVFVRGFQLKDGALVRQLRTMRHNVVVVGTQTMRYLPRDSGAGTIARGPRWRCGAVASPQN